MTERPIIFSGPMVRAILAGRKTVTRRVVKPPKWSRRGESIEVEHLPDKHGRLWPVVITDATGCPADIDCPYGVPGDRLWVREAWRTGVELDTFSPKEIEAAAGEAGWTSGPRCPIRYEADGYCPKWGDNDYRDFGGWGRYRHARFMPNWASRITLEVVDVRVERLQEIDRADAYAEGLPDPGASFPELWDSINGKSHPWSSNPWVWRVEFKWVEAE